MKKKKENDDFPPKLKKVDFVEWSLTIEQWNSAKHLQKIAELERDGLVKDSEIARLKATLKMQVVDTRKNEVAKCESEYNRFKGELEKRLDLSLDDCVIDPITYVIKKL